MARYHVCNDYSLEEMMPEEPIDESKYDTRPFWRGTLYVHKEYDEEHYFVGPAGLDGKQLD